MRSFMKEMLTMYDSGLVLWLRLRPRGGFEDVQTPLYRVTTANEIEKQEDKVAHRVRSGLTC